MEKTASYLKETEYLRISAAREKAEKNCVDEISLGYAWEMARMLTMWQISADVLVAVFLYPLIQHGTASSDVLELEFGKRPVDIAYSLKNFLEFTQNARSKLTEDNQLGLKVYHAEILKNLFILAYADVEKAILISAHRLITVQALEEYPQTEQVFWAQENVAVYLPLLELLGIWVHRRELGNLSLSLSNTDFYQQLEKQINVTYEQHKRLFQQIAQRLHGIFQKQLPDGLILLHDNNPISMSQRIERSRRRGRKFNPDKASIMMVDIIVESVRDCYYALGIIHNCWKPAHRHREFDNGRFIDYIASPRYNGYRCIITTVMVEDITNPDTSNPMQKLVEFRIRTQKMEQINTLGIIAAVNLRESVKSAWWEDNRARQYIRSGNTGSLRNMKEFAVFSPTGEVMYPFEKGSTVVDVAFQVHATLGPYARRIFVNGKPVTHRQPIYHRDIVEIEFDLQYPSIEPEWEEYAKTVLARRSIRKFIRAQTLAPHKGRRIIDDVLEREMNIYQMRFPQEKIDDLLHDVAQRRGCATIDALYVKVLQNEISPDEIVNHLIEAELIGHIIMDDGSRPPFSRITIAQSWFQEKGAKKWDRSSRVLPGVEIVGRVSGKGKKARLVVHRADSKIAPSGDDAIKLTWTPTTTPREVAEVTVTAPPQTRVLSMVTTSLAAIGGEDEAKKLILQKIASEMRDGSLNIEMLIDAPSVKQLDEAQETLAAMERSSYITGFKVWQLFPGMKLLMASRSDKRTQNPFTLRHVRDQSMFFGRDAEITRIVDYIRDDQTFIVLYGQQRIGKTSLLFQLAEYVIPQSCDILPIQFDAHSLMPFNTHNFLLGLADATLHKLSQRFKRFDDRRALKIRQRDFENSPFQTFARWVKKIEERLQGTRLLFMVDEFTRAEEAANKGDIDMDFFHGLQYLAGNANVGFLLCLHDHIYKETSIGWGTYQRGQPVRLLHLERASAAQLIRHPLGRLYTFDDALVEKILDLTDCHPYFIQAICQSLTTDMAQKDHRHITDDDLHQAVNRFLREGQHFFKHYQSQVSEIAWEVLRVIAFRSNHDDPWVSSEDIRETVKRLSIKFENFQISMSIGDLKQAGLIEGRDYHGSAQYSIPVGVFRMWLHDKVTDLLVSQDIKYKG